MSSKCSSRQNNNIHNEDEKRESSTILLESSNVQNQLLSTVTTIETHFPFLCVCF